MKPLPLTLILVAVVTFVVGQLCLKRGMEFSARAELRQPRFAVPFGSGIFLMTLSFFLTLGLLQHFDLSYLYPFQGLSVIFISVLAAIVLKEKLTLRLTVGALLITGGVILVALS